MRLKRLTLAVSLAALSGCAGFLDIDEETRKGDLTPDLETQMQAVRGTTYVREIRTEDLAGQRPVFFTAQNKSLRTVLQETLPGYSIIPRAGVDLNQPVDVASRGMKLSDFIEYIEGTLDLDIKLEGKRVYVSDFEIREWNLATFASTRSIDSVITSKQSTGADVGDSTSDDSSSGTTGSTIGVKLSEDEWQQMQASARRIIGAPDPEKDEGSENDGNAQQGAGEGALSQSVSPQNGGISPSTPGLNFGPQNGQPASENKARKPYVEGIRSVGIMTAGGRPSQIRALENYLKQAIAESTKIINVSVQAYDVVLTNDKQKGIDWNMLRPGSIAGNVMEWGVTSTSSLITTNPIWALNGTFDNGRGTTANTLIRFLEKFGRVELTDQPNLTVRNGTPAQIYAGEEMSYIVDVEQTTDESGVATVTPKLGRLKIGVTLSVTVRVLEDERLLVDVTPVISNLAGYDQISLGTPFDTPRIALKEFSTQLITSSGQPVHMGGLITEKLDKAMERLPWQNVVVKNVLNPFTQSVHNTLERRELVLVVTPTLVEGAN